MERVFRRRLWPWHLVTALFASLAVLAAVATVTALRVDTPWGLDKALFLVGGVLVTTVCIRRVRATRADLRAWRVNRLVLDDEGVCLLLARAGERRVGWSDVRGVVRSERWIRSKGRYPNAVRDDEFSVMVASGPPLAFSALDVPSPVAAARAIAERAGVTVVRGARLPDV